MRDIAADSPGRGPLIRQRAVTAGATLVSTSEQLARSADVILSTVTCSAALDAARQTAPGLAPATSTPISTRVAGAQTRRCRRDSRSGAAFVEAAVMAPVQPVGQRVPMLVGGPAAQRFVEMMAPFGMQPEAMDGPIAAAVKMCRSIVVKGVEALLASAPRRRTYDADDKVFSSLQETWASTGRRRTIRWAVWSCTASAARAKWRKSPQPSTPSASIRSWRRQRRAARIGAHGSI